jgi:hypothetical protein
MAINSKVKGNGFELKVAKILSAWSGQDFNRVPSSGGLRWQTDNNVTGDIVPPMELNFPVNIECKKHEIDWDFSRILCGHSEILDFWKQSCRDSSRLKPKEPWLIFSKNRRDTYIMMRPRAYSILVELKPKLADVEVMHIKVSTIEGYIFSLEKMLEIVTLEDVLSLKL